MGGAVGAVGCCCGVGEVVVGGAGLVGDAVGAVGGVVVGSRGWWVGFFACVARTKFTRRKKCV